MDNITRRKGLVEEYNRLNQMLIGTQIRMQRILGQLELLEEMEKGEDKTNNDVKSGKSKTMSSIQKIS